MSKIQLRVGDLRKRKKIAQKELADALGIAVQTVSKWENDFCGQKRQYGCSDRHKP